MKRSLIPWYSNRAHVYDIEFQGGEVALNHIASVATSPPPGDGDLLPPGCALWHCGLYGNLMTIQRCCEVVVLDPVTGRWDIWGRRFSASSSCEDAHLTVVRPLRCYLSTPGNTHWRMLCVHHQITIVDGVLIASSGDSIQGFQVATLTQPSVPPPADYNLPDGLHESIEGHHSWFINTVSVATPNPPVFTVPIPIPRSPSQNARSRLWPLLHYPWFRNDPVFQSEPILTERFSDESYPQTGTQDVYQFKLGLASEKTGMPPSVELLSVIQTDVQDSRCVYAPGVTLPRTWKDGYTEEEKMLIEGGGQVWGGLLYSEEKLLLTDITRNLMSLCVSGRFIHYLMVGISETDHSTIYRVNVSDYALALRHRSCQ